MKNFLPSELFPSLYPSPSKELAAKSDVVVHNFLPAVVRRNRIAYEDFAAVNPKLIYAEITGKFIFFQHCTFVVFDKIFNTKIFLTQVTAAPGRWQIRQRMTA